MHIADKFKQICDTNRWSFDYGRRDYHNLNDFESDAALPENVHFLLDPVIINEKRSAETGALENVTYTGGFIFCVKADLDTNYKEKFENYIKPLKSKIDTIISANLNACSEYEVSVWKLTEVIDILDTNVSGYIVEFEIKEEN
jgi:hypothetical protein